MNVFKRLIHLTSWCLYFIVTSVFSQTQEFHLTLKNHTFTPNTLTIPANKKVKLIINNLDDVAEEFDSFDLNREKVIFPHSKGTIFIGPLPKGKYEYFGEFHPDTARGVIMVEDINHVN